jgi:hypothetical protein
MVTAWFHTGLKEVLAFGLPGVALVAAAIAVVWAVSGAWLGKAYNAVSDNGTLDENQE